MRQRPTEGQAPADARVEDPSKRDRGDPRARSQTEDKSSTPAQDDAQVEEEAPEEDEPAAAEAPDPDGTYEGTCDYLLGDGGAEGYRFIADAKMVNTGNIGTVNDIKAVWYLGGGGKIVKEKTVRTNANTTKRVGFDFPASSDDIDRHQSVEGDCKVVVTIVDTFGAVK